jgi:hypothetical protein
MQRKKNAQLQFKYDFDYIVYEQIDYIRQVGNMVISNPVAIGSFVNGVNMLETMLGKYLRVNPKKYAELETLKNDLGKASQVVANNAQENATDNIIKLNYVFANKKFKILMEIITSQMRGEDETDEVI